MYFQRSLENKLRNISETFPVLMLTGPRQVGKSTLLAKMAEKNRKSVSLDNITIREQAKHDPELFLERYSPPVLIDEIQYAPELLDYIKVYVDNEKKCGDYWLTGSQTFHLMKGVSQSLAGRVGVVRMLGLSNSEILGNHAPPFEVEPRRLIQRLGEVPSMNIGELFARIFKGSMPRLYEMPNTDRDTYFGSYLETYISRDVKDLSQVADELAFLSFIRIVAARTATNVNYSTLAKEAGISSPTAKHWLSILVSSGLVALIPPFSSNALNRVIKTPRMYFLDTGLCAFICRWPSPEVLESGAMDGAFFETWVVSEIYKSYINNGQNPPLYFYRDSNSREIDLIIHTGAVVSPIEIKKGAAPKDAPRHFQVLGPIEKEPSEEELTLGTAHIKTEIGMGAVICMPADILPIDRKNWLVPAWLI